MREIEQSKAVLESRYESRLNQFQHLNESLDASGMIESHEAELDKLRTTQVFIKRKYTWSNNMQTDTSSSIYKHVSNQCLGGTMGLVQIWEKNICMKRWTRVVTAVFLFFSEPHYKARKRFSRDEMSHDNL